MTRPPVSVVVPFSGSAAEGHRVLSRLAQLEVRADDELIVVDNSPTPALEARPTNRVLIVRATRERSSYHARNVGAEASRGSWILFVDADCRPTPGLLDAYFSPPPGERCGALAGEIDSALEQSTFIARWARSRQLLSQSALSLVHPFRPFGSTANLLVRRAAFEDAGGFAEGASSAADADLCWRLQELGWSLEYRAEAVVEHFHRDNLADLLRQMGRYGRGRAWLERRFPESRPPAGTLREIVRPAGASLYHLLRGKPAQAGFRGLDGLALAAQALSRPFSNRPPRVRHGRRPVTTLCSECFPTAAEIQPSTGAGRPVRVEAVRRPVRLQLPSACALDVAYLEDDAVLDRLRALGALALRHPIRIARFAIASKRKSSHNPVRGLASLAPAARRVIRAGGQVEGTDRVGTDLARDLARLSGGTILGNEDQKLHPGVAAG
jgi:GT2 family glycosyltransferase